MSRFFRLRTRGFLEQLRQNHWPETLCQVSPHQVPNAVGCAARAFRRLDHLVIVGYMDQPCHLGAFRHFTKVLLWRLPHPIHLSCISNPLTLGELRTASEHRFPHFHPCHRRIASVCPADGQAVPGHSEHAARRAVALGGSTTLAVRPTFLNGRLDHRSAPGGVAGGYGAGVGHGSLCKVRGVFSPDNSNSTAFICLCLRGEYSVIENRTCLRRKCRAGTSSLPPSRPLLAPSVARVSWGVSVAIVLASFWRRRALLGRPHSPPGGAAVICC